tara:strand:- start:4697 stop:4951 length:255 start_codon:yes stop_codon:yes gene_type:complete
MLLKDVIEKASSASSAEQSGLSGEDTFKALKYLSEKITVAHYINVNVDLDGAPEPPAPAPEPEPPAEDGASEVNDDGGSEFFNG